MTTFKVLQSIGQTWSGRRPAPVFAVLDDGASQHGDEKNKKITASLFPSPGKTTAFVLVAVIFLFFSLAGYAHAETTGPEWKILSVSTPTNFNPAADKSGADAIMLTAVNVGGTSTDGSRVTIADALPEGLVAIEAFGVNTYHDPNGRLDTTEPPEQEIGGVPCTFSARAVSCTTSEPIDPGDTLVITIRVDVEPTAESGEINRTSVSGGGAISASASNAVTISSQPPPYGVAQGGLLAATSTSQAGGHPNLTQEFFLNTVNPEGETAPETCISADETPPACKLKSVPVTTTKDVRFDLPKGSLGTTVGVARCTMAQVENASNCPRNTMMGTATVIVFSSAEGRLVFTVPVYNIAPAPGEPLALAFDALYFPVRIDTSVLSDGEYNARVTVPDITTAAPFYMSSVTVWGDPAEHNGPGPDSAARALENNSAFPYISFGGPGVEASGAFPTVYDKRVAFLTNPTQCSEALTGMIETDSWEAPGEFGGAGTASTPMGTATGCGQLSFKPEVSMLPDTLEAGAPAGYAFDLTVPQNTEAEGLATPYVKRTSVTLPLGTVISPSAADGLGDCSSVEFFGPESERNQPRPATPGECPENSQVGTVRVKTPSLEEQLTGDVYLGAPECTGPGGVCTPEDAADGHMVHLYVQLVGEGEDGVVVKIEGHGYINQQTGQITTVFANTPQLPFSEFKLTLQGGERATLSNPRTCGQVHTTADLTPWSTPFTPDGTPESTFDVDRNCFGPQFHPSFSASTTSVRAGEFTPFTLAFGRSDSDEFLNGAQITMPPGLLGMLSKVKLCEEPQAGAGTCGAASQIGEVSVQTGPGADPFLVTGGKVYITGPYKGAPYGLSIVVPAKAGPYTLAGTTGNGTVVNRSAISVNPETSALTVTADPLPTELDGIPLQLRLVNVTINRSEFTFNPTNCDNPAVSGILTSTEAASASESSSLQILDCAKLAFKPKFAATSNAHTSKKDGASLLFKVSYPKGAQGSDAWLKQMKFDIPRQLPARLTTLQKACPVATFEKNPATCPAAAVIGKAIVHTPVLSVPLEGPVYFVSHGGAKFPEVVLVLQGGGVTLELHGETFISHAGVTSATFRTVPDAPFETAEVFVPTGPFSEFAAIGNLCTQKLVMPTVFNGQNGGTLKQNTKISVTGCPKAKKATKKKKPKKARKAGTNRGATS